jgi:hypothetical protein
MGFQGHCTLSSHTQRQFDPRLLAGSNRMASAEAIGYFSHLSFFRRADFTTP